MVGVSSFGRQGSKSALPWMSLPIPKFPPSLRILPVLLGSIDLDQWRVILRLELRGEILELARHGWEPVRRLLDSIPSTLPAWCFVMKFKGYVIANDSEEYLNSFEDTLNL
jgi:hypothetical protein